MHINPFVFRNYDIRGVAGTDLDAEKVEVIAKAYGTYLRRRKITEAVLGHDCRVTGEEYRKAFIKGLTEEGVNVIDLGLVMTQMVYFAQYRFQSNGGVMITASHNPWNYNGFKLATGYSKTTLIPDVAEIRSLTETEEFFDSDTKGTVRTLDKEEKEAFVRDYTHDVIKRVRIKKRFKVVIDSGMGTTGIFNPAIFREAGCEVIERNTEVDGKFPMGTPDPTSTTMMDRVRKVVLEEKADIGVAFDGDGDRVGMVDETGNILWNDVMVAIFAQEILERFPGSKIVHNDLCSQVTTKVIEKNGGIPIMWRTGHSFIKAKIAEEGAAFGGELSGHFFFADNAYGHDDGTYAVLRVIEYLSDKGTTLSKLYGTFPKYISSPEVKIGCPDGKKELVIKDLSEKFKADFLNAKITDDTVIPDTDGTRADFDDGMMIFRYSQNGPYITIKFEATDQKIYDERKVYVRKTLERYPEMIWEDELAVNLSSLD